LTVVLSLGSLFLTETKIRGFKKMITKDTLLSIAAIGCLVIMLGIVGMVETAIPDNKEVQESYKLIIHAGVDMSEVPNEWLMEGFK
jgi:hypothetical protein